MGLGKKEEGGIFEGGGGWGWGRVDTPAHTMKVETEKTFNSVLIYLFLLLEVVMTTAKLYSRTQFLLRFKFCLEQTQVCKVPAGNKA